MLTGHPEKPPLWISAITVASYVGSREEVLQEAKTFVKEIALRHHDYLGTGFCPSGWNTENGSFDVELASVSDPKKVIDKLHKDHFRVAVHSVILSDRLHAACMIRASSRGSMQSASCYWDTHRKVFAQGVDGWWPDEGDPLDIPSRLVRNRMYWMGRRLIVRMNGRLHCTAMDTRYAA